MLNYTNKYIAILTAKDSGGKEVITGNILGCYDGEKSALEGFSSLAPKAVEMVRRQSEMLGKAYIFAHLYLFQPGEIGDHLLKPQFDIVKIDFTFKDGKLV